MKKKIIEFIEAQYAQFVAIAIVMLFATSMFAWLATVMPDLTALAIASHFLLLYPIINILIEL